MFDPAVPGRLASPRRSRRNMQSLKIIWDIDPKPFELRVVDKGKRLNGVGLAESATLGGWETGRERLSSTAFPLRCAQINLWQGARRFRTGLKHTPQWVCNRRATQPQAKFGATLRAAVLFRPDFVTRSFQIHCGICRPCGSTSRLVWPKNPLPCMYR